MIKKIIFLFLFSVLLGQEPEIIYLSWQNDPSTTMTILWHTDSGNGPNRFLYKLPQETYWKEKQGTLDPIDRSSVVVHHAELKHLLPDSEYLFRFEDGKIYRFKTMPKGLTHPLKIVIGGDGYFSKELFQKMNETVVAHDPDFVIMGGDVAYTEGLRRALRTRHWKINRWQEFFKMWSDQMVTKEGRKIPIMPVIGNHDVKEGFDNPFKKKVLFYQFFVFKEKGVPFRTMEIGDDLIFYLLDSGHTFPVGGAQAEWLEKALSSHQNAIYKIPVYHIPAYPSETPPTHRSSMDIRKFWVPLFEKYGVKVSMEHDCHTFKTTFPIWKNEKNAQGILYLGDGTWGVYPEKPRKYWYLAKALQINNVWVLEIDREKIHFQAIDNENRLIDQLTIPSGITR